jgi:hypothetical protein
MRQRLRKGLCTVKHFYDLWNSRQAIHYHLRQLLDSNFAAVVGSIPWPDEASNLRVYIAREATWRRNQQLHDALAHLVAIQMRLPYQLAPNTDPELEPDITWTAPTGDRIHGEMCTGSCSYPTIYKRQDEYAAITDTLLWICAGFYGTDAETRMEELRQHSTAIEGIGWFSTLSRVLAEGRTAPFFNHADLQTSVAEIVSDFQLPSKTETTNSSKKTRISAGK